MHISPRNPPQWLVYIPLLLFELSTFPNYYSPSILLHIPILILLYSFLLAWVQCQIHFVPWVSPTPSLLVPTKDLVALLHYCIILVFKYLHQQHSHLACWDIQGSLSVGLMALVLYEFIWLLMVIHSLVWFACCFEVQMLVVKKLSLCVIQYLVVVLVQCHGQE